MLAAGHLSNLDPWAIGLALWPRRFLRFMAKAELFWFPLSVIAAGAGAFKVNRGQADYAAIETAVRLARAGNVIAMFPEGTRRRKGLRKTREAGAHTGAARIALEAGGAARPGGDQGHRRPAPARAAGGCATASRSSSTISRSGARRGGAHRDRPPDGGDPGARSVAVSGLLLAIDGDSLAHRAYHALPKSIRLNALVGFAGFLQRLWESEQPESVLVGWDSLDTPTYRHEALPAYQSGRVFEDSIVEQLDLLPGARRVVRLPGGEGARLRGRRLPRGRRRARGPGQCSLRRPTATRSSSSRSGSRSCSR